MLPSAQTGMNYFTSAHPLRSAGFQTCCVADFLVGPVLNGAQAAGLETRDTAGLETCATSRDAKKLGPYALASAATPTYVNSL